MSSDLGKLYKHFWSRGKTRINPMPEIAILNIHARYFGTFVYVFNVLLKGALKSHTNKKQ